MYVGVKLINFNLYYSYRVKILHYGNKKGHSFGV